MEPRLMTMAQPMPPLTLYEYQCREAVALTHVERDSLRALVSSLRISPTVGREGHYDLTPGAEVGAVTLPGLAVQIRPKLPISQVLFLVSYAIDPQHWRDLVADFAVEELALVEAIIPGFARQVRQALARGLLHGYRLEEDALLTIRGRIRWDDQIKRRFGRFPPAEVSYDEFTADITENRLLRAAAARLRQLPLRSAYTPSLLRGLDGQLEDVSLITYDARAVPTVTYTRLNEYYRGAVELARLILQNTTIELHHDTVQSSAFLVDMNKVFENFVIIALREELRLDDRAFPQGTAGQHLYLDRAGRVRLEPDLSWWEGGRCTLVGDVKYKHIQEGEVKHADIYQMLAYTTATGLPGGLLIYAAGEAAPVVHEVIPTGKQIEVMTLDLRGTPDQILSQIQDVAARIRVLHDQGRTTTLSR